MHHPLTLSRRRPHWLFMVGFFLILMLNACNLKEKPLTPPLAKIDSYLEWNGFKIGIPAGFELEKNDSHYLYISNIPQEEQERVKRMNDELRA